MINEIIYNIEKIIMFRFFIVSEKDLLDFI